jgi:hypothetical protein
MTISSDEAGAMLRDVDGIVAKVKRSRLYRTSGEAFMVWGTVVVAGNVVLTVAPRWAGWGWAALNLLGVVAMIVLLQRRMRGGAAAAARIPLRFLAAFAVFFAFGWAWCRVIGQFGPRQQDAFWPTLFMFGYTLAELWFGAAFSAIGLGLAALILAGFFWSGECFRSGSRSSTAPG